MHTATKSLKHIHWHRDKETQISTGKRYRQIHTTIQTKTYINQEKDRQTQTQIYRHIQTTQTHRYTTKTHRHNKTQKNNRTTREINVCMFV